MRYAGQLCLVWVSERNKKSWKFEENTGSQKGCSFEVYVGSDLCYTVSVQVLFMEIQWLTMFQQKSSKTNPNATAVYSCHVPIPQVISHININD